MSLIELSQYFEKNKSATLDQLQSIFKEDRELLIEMLELLVKKNKICCRTLKPACGKTCLQCDLAKATLYETISKSEP